MSLETLLAAAEYLEWRSGQESIGSEHSASKEGSQYPSSPVKRGATSAAYASQSQLSDAKNEDSSESGERKRWAGTREVHNKLEKNRRAHLKECFEMLRQEIPSIDDRKISNLSILQKAIRHVQSLTAKDKEFEIEKKRLADINVAYQAKSARLKQEVKAMGVIDDVDTWVTSLVAANANDCSTSTASECGDAEECFEENAIKVDSRGPRKSWKTEASWPLTNGKVELKVLRMPPQQPPQPQQPALQRMQHAAVRATLQQRLHMRVNSDVSVASVPSPPVDRANGLTGSSDPSARHATQSCASVPPSLSFEPSGVHSSALIRAARAAGHPAAIRGSVPPAAGGGGGASGIVSSNGTGSVGVNSISNIRPDCSGGISTASMTSQASHGAPSHGVVLSSVPMQQQQQQQQQHLFLLPTGTSALVATAAAAAPLQSTVAALGIPGGAKRLLAPLQPVAVSAAGTTISQPIVGATGLVFPAQPFTPAAAAAMFPYNCNTVAAAMFLDALRHTASPLSLVPCHAPPGRDQLLQQPQPHKPAAAACSSATAVSAPTGGGVVPAAASLPTGEPAALRPTAVMPSSSSPFRPVGHAAAAAAAGTGSLVTASSSVATVAGGGEGLSSAQQQLAAAGSAVRSAIGASSGGALPATSGTTAQLHIQTAGLPASPSPMLAKQAPLHIVTAPQQYVLMMAAPAPSQDSAPSIVPAGGQSSTANFEPSSRSLPSAEPRESK